MDGNGYKWKQMDCTPKKKARASSSYQYAIDQIKGGRDRYEYVFTIGKMLIES